ncbi:helix-turn-helix domain-containing protein [Hymenobacter koreensis]|uniref:Helix-turn-helix domain-containing protein n=1 Tax=Hymenobacter koreensis TaxID=1084523 RepID=A0ABP8J1W2_9BACT
MGRQRHSLRLSRKQQVYLTDFINSDTISRQQRNRAQVLQHWLADWSAEESGKALELSIDRVYSMRRSYSQQGFRDYLHAVPRCGAPTKLTPKLETLLRKLTQDQATKGKRWTLPRLAERIVELGYADRICTLTVHKALKQIKASTVASRLAHSTGAPCGSLLQALPVADEQAA